MRRTETRIKVSGVEKDVGALGGSKIDLRRTGVMVRCRRAGKNL